MPKEESMPVRKKMRKGTHSCFECRRRKIRCIFPSDNPDVCSECFARGSRCIDQENANPDVIVDHRKNLRERVSRLEALVDSLLDEKSEASQGDSSSQTSKTPNLVTRDTYPPTPISSEASSSIFQTQQHQQQRTSSDRGHHIPILSVLEDALNDAEEKLKARSERLSRKDSYPPPPPPAEERFTVTAKNAEDMMDDGSAAYKAKCERAKHGLMSMLPSYEELNRICNTNSLWWQTWRRKCSGTSDADETLSQFASKAVASGNIGALGTVVLSIGICTADEKDIDRYLEAVDRWVLSDDEYAATLEGMECLILKAKWYADVGQPRRAWLAYRKGLMYTQLMGLHRQRTSSAAHESIWWSLYHGDRFLSLLLGLPYGISDVHCDLSLPEMGGEYMAPLVFMNNVSILAGKVIDRNQSLAEQSFAWALQLDQELEDLWKKLDPKWLEYTELMADVEKNAAEIRERVMAQMVFHQIRVYLHLPFMLKSQTNSRFSYSRTACLNGSREVLRVYQDLRTGEVQPLYECKAIDFVGFTAAVLLTLGLFNYGAASMSATTSPKDQETDVRLVEASIDIFRRASSEKGGKVAAQSAQVLERMMSKHKAEQNGEQLHKDMDDCTEFVIPYFGTISIKRGGRRPAQPPAKKFDNNKLSHRPMVLTTNTTQSTPTSESTTGSDFFSQHHSLHTPITSTSTSTKPLSTSNTNPSSALNFPTDPFSTISYDGFYNWPNISPDATTPNVNGSSLGTNVNDDSMNNYPLPTNNFSWQNMPMDIDQDWSWFLNDGNTGNGSGSVTTTVPVGTQQVDDQFANQSFVGFG